MIGYIGEAGEQMLRDILAMWRKASGMDTGSFTELAEETKRLKELDKKEKEFDGFFNDFYIQCKNCSSYDVYIERDGTDGILVQCTYCGYEHVLKGGKR